MIHRRLYLWYRRRELDRFLLAAVHAREIQHRVLFEKLARNADSDFGRAYRFAAIRSLADFRRQVPITRYADYAPYIERVKRGDPQAMFGPGTRLLMFALTSGTTAQPKYIPITEEYYREYRNGWNLWGIGAYGDHVDLLGKKVLGLGSDWRQYTTEGGTPCGNITGLVTETAPWMVRSLYINPWALIKIPDAAARHYTALRLALASHNVGMVLTANPSTLVGLARLADARAESLVRDIRNGTLARDIEMPSAVRRLIEPLVRRRSVHRAAELDAIARRAGHLYPRDFWPGLAVLGVWQGGAAGAYAPRLEEFYGPVALRDHGLSASEGRMTIPLADGTASGLLEFIHHYFEFIPEEEHDSPRPTVLEAHELEVGRRYFILLTTSAGLYRYDIHDLVRCTGYRGEAPMLEFLNKGSAFSSVTGEKLSEYQVTRAVGEAMAACGLAVETYTLAPEFGDPPRYVLLIEEGHAGLRPDRLARGLDERLSRANCEYANRRTTGRLGPVAVRQLPRGTWDAYRSRRLARSDGAVEQYKHPCLSGDLDFVEGFWSECEGRHEHAKARIKPIKVGYVIPGEKGFWAK